ncbi:MAG: hypothetical protein E7175_00510 [Erysipelotrichaceae bacterium]|nr:hypothetical protein [Erysipelotrichaceae bacterium]
MSVAIRDATNKRTEFKDNKASPHNDVGFVLWKKNFYFVKNEFFERFSDCNLMVDQKGKNKRPYYCLKDSELDLYWMIPLSSQLDKYKAIYNNKIKK